MKNFLKKLHIGPSHAPDDVDPAHDQNNKPLSSLSNWLNSVTNKHTSQPPTPPRAPAPDPPGSSSSSWETLASGRMRRVTHSTPTPSCRTEAAGSSVSSSSETLGSDRARRESGSGPPPPPREHPHPHPHPPPEEVLEVTAASAPVAADDDDLEDYQLQLALELSAKEDPEAVQIEVAKQISLGSCPVESTPAEVVAYRYWVSASSQSHLLQHGIKHTL